jgi:hypothetical protein
MAKSIDRAVAMVFVPTEDEIRGNMLGSSWAAVGLRWFNDRQRFYQQ